MNLLVSLGKYSVLKLIQEWLPVEDVCFFDTALCNTELRAQFQEFFSRNKVVLHGSTFNKVQDDYLLWLLRRNMAPDHVILNKKSLVLLQENSIGHQVTFTSVELHNLDLNDPTVTSLLLDLIRNCPDVSALKFCRCDSVNFSDLTAVLGCSSLKLKGVHFLLCEGMKTNRTVVTPEASSSLENVKFEACSSVEDKEIIQVTGNNNILLTSLVVVSTQDLYNHRHKVTSASVVHVINNCPNLCVFDIETNDNVSFKIWSQLMTKCPLITDLTLHSSNYETSNNALSCVADNLPMLKRLVVGGKVFMDVIEIGLINICSKCAFLEELAVNFLIQTHKTTLTDLFSGLHVTGLEFKTPRYSADNIMILCDDPHSITDMLIAFQPPSVTKRERECIDSIKSIKRTSFIDALLQCKSLCKLSSLLSVNTVQQLVELVPQCDNLTVLNLEGVSGGCCSDTFLKALCTHYQRLVVLNLKECYFITDDGLVPLLKVNPNLTDLSVNFCDKLTDKTMIALAKYCKQLSVLDIVACDFVTDSAMITLSQNCTDLKEISLNGCHNVTDVGVMALYRNCGGLLTVHGKVTKKGRLGSVKK